MAGESEELMFSKNHIVSIRQMKRLLVLDLFSGTSLVLPVIVGRLSGSSGIFALLAGGGAAGLFALFLLNTGKGFDGSYPRFCEDTLGRGGARIVMAIYALRFLVTAALLLGVFAQIINHTFLSDIPKAVLGIAMLLLCIYCVFKGLETRARLGEMLVYLVIVPIVLIIILAIPQIHLDRLFPVKLLAAGDIGKETPGAGGLSGLIWASVITFSLFSVVEWLLFLRPSVKKQEKARRGALMSILWPVLLNLLILVACIGIFSVPGMNNESWPTVTLMQIVRFPGGFLSRQDGLMLAFWMAGMFMLIGANIYYGLESFKSISKKLCKPWIIVFPGIFVLACFLGIYLQDATRLFVSYMTFIYMPLAVLTPVLLRTVRHFRQRRRGALSRQHPQSRQRMDHTTCQQRPAGDQRGAHSQPQAEVSGGSCSQPQAEVSGRNFLLRQAGTPGGRLSRRFVRLAVVLAVFLGMSGLCGCDNLVEIEDRNYVMCLGLDVEGDELSVSFGFPDLKALTGDGDNIHYPAVTLSGRDMESVERSYAARSNKKLDYGQLQMIVFGRAMLENEARMREVLEYIRGNQAFTRTVLVCMADEKASDIVALDEEVNGSIGVYLRQMFDNNSRDYQMTIGDLIIGLSLDEEPGKIAVVAKGEQVPLMVGVEDTSFY